MISQTFTKAATGNSFGTPLRAIWSGAAADTSPYEVQAGIKPLTLG